LAALYITSPAKGSGKTSVCAGLGKHLQDEGKNPGYLKPVTAGSGVPAGEDSDAAFMKKLLSLAEPVEALCPSLSGKGGPAGSIGETFIKVTHGRDVVIIEGSGNQAADRDIAKALNAGVIVVETDAASLSGNTNMYKDYGNLLLGVILNKVPKNRIEQARDEASARLNKNGINLLGVIPEDRMLLAATIGELTGRINGEILRGGEQADELVENVMLGALTVDHGPDYFGRKENKMVVLRSDRPDMQMAAMETSTRCMVVTGDTPLKAVVLERAEEKNMPIIRAKDNAAIVVENIENALGGNKLSQENKADRLAETIVRYLNIEAVYKGLDIAV
jgi:BioD-like phosphotransacetylase family protein